MKNLNMNWKVEELTVYALNENEVNDFSFHVQGNGRSGYNDEQLTSVVNMAASAPDMYRSLRDLVDMLSVDRKYVHLDEVERATKVLSKAIGEL